MEEINQIKSQLKDKGINPNGILGQCIEKVILDLKQEIENLKKEKNIKTAPMPKGNAISFCPLTHNSKFLSNTTVM